jgi:hypothetical protein
MPQRKGIQKVEGILGQEEGILGHPHGELSQE